MINKNKYLELLNATNKDATSEPSVQLNSFEPDSISKHKSFKCDFSR